MANTKSAKKNIRSSKRKKAHNTVWKKNIKEAVRAIKDAIAAKSGVAEDFAKKLQLLQKMTDKAVKEKVIHKNKSNKLKSIYARKISAFLSIKPTKAVKSSRAAK